ncbi:MAG: TetR/AcrR family transcriptional regulator [Acholeplasmataceae bacterium]
MKNKETDGIVKQKNRVFIIKCAKKVFLEKGIASTSIADIAQEAKMERKTIYNHFQTKEMIAENIFLNSLDAISQSMGELIDYSTAKNGFDRVKAFFVHFVDTLFKLKEEVLFTVHYDYYFRTTAKTDYVSNVLMAHQHPEVIKFVNQGIRDGSIGLDNKEIVTTFRIIGLSLMSYVSRILFRGHIIEAEMGITEKSAYDFLDLLLKGMRITQNV